MLVEPSDADDHCDLVARGGGDRDAASTRSEQVLAAVRDPTEGPALLLKTRVTGKRVALRQCQTDGCKWLKSRPRRAPIQTKRDLGRVRGSEIASEAAAELAGASRHAQVRE